MMNDDDEKNDIMESCQHRYVVNGGDGLFRDDQKMHRRLRVDVTERQGDVVFVEDVRGDFAVDDLGENRL